MHLTIYVARDGHRGIILGKQGSTIRRIGMAARIELEEALDRRIHILSHVKVRKDWMDDAAGILTGIWLRCLNGARMR